jgi:hypothetical protein
VGFTFQVILYITETSKPKGGFFTVQISISFLGFNPSLEKNFKIENSRFSYCYFFRPLFIEGDHDERFL